MEMIKACKSVEFDVIYDDGTRRHVTEGILFQVENERLLFHNGTNRPEVLLAVSEAAAELVGRLKLPYKIMERHFRAVYKNMTEGGTDNGNVQA